MANHANLMAGLYPNPESAQQALKHFEEADFRPEHLMLETGRRQPVDDELLDDPTVQDVTHDAVLGGVIGGALGAGAVGTVGLLAPMVFAATPVLGPLMALGYGAAIGSTAGAVAALRLEPDEFSKLLDDAQHHGYSAVLVRIKSEREQALAEEIFRETTSERPLES